jgi:hypothetical protein
VAPRARKAKTFEEAEGHAPGAGAVSVGILVAVVAAILAFAPTIGGISTWKVVLGVIGLTLFVIAGFDRKR